MAENPSPATQPEPEAAAGELNFDQPAAENPRIKRRNLKATPKASPKVDSDSPAVPEVASEVAFPVVEPAKTEAAAPERAAETASPARPNATPVAVPSKGVATPVSRSSSSPHGTRPATLYYRSYAGKDKEASPAAKPVASRPAAAPASTVTSSATARPSASSPGPTTTSSQIRPPASSSVTHPAPSSTPMPSSTSRPPSSFGSATPSSAARPAATPTDYRANVERQNREQKSVGNILAYFVYALIAFFVLGASLAGYGGYVLSKRIQDQSVTVSDLDQHYATVNKDLTAKLAGTQESLSLAQAQLTRQQDLISKQQDAINRLIAATNDTVNGLKLEKQARLQDAANLRARIRDIEYRSPANTSTQPR